MIVFCSDFGVAEQPGSTGGGDGVEDLGRFFAEQVVDIEQNQEVVVELD